MSLRAPDDTDGRRNPHTVAYRSTIIVDQIVLRIWCRRWPTHFGRTT